LTSFKWVRKFNWLYKIDNNHIDNSKSCIDNINKEFNICKVKNNEKNELSDNENYDDNIEINDENFMEIVEKNLSLINCLKYFLDFIIKSIYKYEYLK